MDCRGRLLKGLSCILERCFCCVTYCGKCCSTCKKVRNECSACLRSCKTRCVSCYEALDCRIGPSEINLNGGQSTNNTTILHQENEYLTLPAAPMVTSASAQSSNPTRKEEAGGTASATNSHEHTTADYLATTEHLDGDLLTTGNHHSVNNSLSINDLQTNNVRPIRANLTTTYQNAADKMSSSLTLTAKSTDWPYMDIKKGQFMEQCTPSPEPVRTKTEEEEGEGDKREHNGRIKPGKSLEAFPSNLIKKEQLEDYLNHAIRSGAIDEEFQNIPPRFNKTVDIATLPSNRRKNRYTNNLPYDDTRVVLSTNSLEYPKSDYINANFIRSYKKTKAYIATQGPKDNNDSTIDDFWKMVWENNTNVIVMLAKLVEGGRVKVSQYWPDQLNVEMEYGEVRVEQVSFEERLDCHLRRFMVSTEDESR
ncbi:Receptor-type tyrosine-protein phosphatase gamma-like, partial [Homarus americanus]